MKSALVFFDEAGNLDTKIEDLPIPEPGDDEILIKVEVAGSNPKDYIFPGPKFLNKPLNSGDDVGGIVEAVGKNVYGFARHDRVAGFHVMGGPSGCYAEYTLCPSHTVFHIPASMSFEEAATIPLAAYTAAIGLNRNLLLPLPFARTDDAIKATKHPLIINGASSAVGSFVAQLARLSPAISPIIGVAGASADHAELSGCDVVVNYKSPTVAEDLRAALKGEKCRHVFDANNNVASVEYLLAVLEKDSGSRYTCVTMLDKNYNDGDGRMQEMLVASGLWYETMYVGSLHAPPPPGGELFGGVTSRLFEMLIRSRKLKGMPFKVIPNGLDGVKGGLTELMSRKSGNEKFVYRVGETPGLV